MAKPNLAQGDVVIIKNDLLPRGDWSLGIVVKVFPSESDGLVRSVRLKVGDRTLDKQGKRQKAESFLDRPINKLILLVKKEP